MAPHIYVDRNQCDYFGIDYLNAKVSFVIASDALWRSKGGDGYDQDTSDYLKSVWAKTLVLKPSASDGPGWFKVDRVY